MSVAQQQTNPYHRRVVPPDPPPRPSSTLCAGLQPPCNPVATAQLSDGFPGKATNLRVPGRRESRVTIGMKMRRGKRDLCATESTCTRASGLISGIRRGRNDLIPYFNPSLLSAPRYQIIQSSALFHPFFYPPRAGTLPRTGD